MPKMWRVFSELLGPQIISLLNVDYCGTSEYFSGRKTKESLLSEQNFDGQANWSGVVSFYCIQMSLVMSMRFIFGDDWNDSPCSSRFCSLAMMLFLSNRGP